MYLFTLNTTVPTPSVTVTALNTQIVGQPLTLTCNAVTVRGITSNLDIVWRRGGNVLTRVENVGPTEINSTLVMYTDAFTISQLNTTDDGGVYECVLEVDTSPVIRISDTITLDVSGRCYSILCCTSHCCWVSTLCRKNFQSQSLSPYMLYHKVH